jgi:hypothetical protein
MLAELAITAPCPSFVLDIGALGAAGRRLPISLASTPGEAIRGAGILTSGDHRWQSDPEASGIAPWRLRGLRNVWRKDLP